VSEELLRAIVDDQTELVCRFDADFRLVFSNKAHARLFGLTPEGIAGLDLFEGVPERLRAGLRAELLALTPERPVHLGVNEKVTAQGEVRWFEWVNRALFDASGRRVGLQAVGRDVTEQHLAEAALRASEARYRAVVEAQTEFVLRMSAEGRPTLVNDAYCRYVGQSREELLDPARVHLENVAPDDRPRYEAHLRSLTLERPSAGIELRARLPDGRIRWEQWTDTGVFDGEGRLAEVQSVGRDVTERREAERRLVESEARYRAVVEGQTEFILRLRPDGTLTFVNDAYCRYRGLPREVLLAGFDDVAHYPEAQQARVRAAWAGLSPERPAVAYGLEEPRADDGPRWQEWTDTGIFDAEGRLAEVQAVGRDVTERRRAEVALKESEELLRAIVDDQTEVISRFDAGFRLVFCNLAFARLFFDRTPVEALGACLFDLVPEQIRDDLRARLLALTPERPALRATGERLLPGGGVRRLEWVNRALFDASGRRVGLQAVGRDVTEQHLAEAALRASEARLAAVHGARARSACT
jgi:PAS domain S-box-containing protein